MDDNNFLLLYKKVFNNIFLSKLIYKFVRYEDWDEKKEFQELDYSIYLKIRNSYRVFDLNIEKLLSLKMYKLFDDFVEFYFKVVIFNKERYWEFQCIELQTKNDLIQLLQYKELGFNRFLKFYQHFETEFKRFNRLVLENAAIGGNWEIYKYLLHQKSGLYKVYNKLPLLSNVCNNYRDNNVPPPSFYNLSGLLYSCGNNELYFKELLDSNIISFSDSHISYGVVNEISMASRFGYRVYLNYLIENEPFGRGYWKSVEQYVSDLVIISLTLSDLELAKLIINTPRLIKNFKLKNPPDLINIPIDYNVLKLYKNIANQHQQDNSLSLLSIEQINYFQNYSLFPNIINFNFQLVDWDHNIISLVLDNTKLNGYMPSLEEFKYLIESNLLSGKLLRKPLFWNDLLVYITNVLFNVDYLKYVLDFSKNHQYLSNVLVLKPCCFDSKLPIVKFLFENFQKYKAISFTNFTSYTNQNLFFGDPKSVEYILNYQSSMKMKFLKSTITKINKNSNSSQLQDKFNNLFNGMFSKEVDINAHYEMFKYCLGSKLYTESVFTQHLSSSCGSNYQRFKIFKSILKKKKLDHITSYFTPSVFDGNNNFKSEFLISNPIIHHYLCRSKSIDFDPSNLFHYKQELSVDLFLLKQFQHQFQQFSPTTCGNIVFSMFKSLSTKLSVLQYLVTQLSLKPSNLKISGSSDAELFNLCLNVPKLFCFFIHNDYQWIENNIFKIINYSCKNRFLIYLNLILSSNHFGNDFKLKLMVGFIFYSISKSNDVTNLDTSLWFLKLNCNGLEDIVSKNLKIIENEIKLLSSDPPINSNGCFKFYLKFNLIFDSVSKVCNGDQYNNFKTMTKMLEQISNYYIRYTLQRNIIFNCINDTQDILDMNNPLQLKFK